MQRSDFKVGMSVKFGRPNGEKTIGTIIKLNPKKAKVDCPARGKHEPGVWTVPYTMLTIVDATSSPITQNVVTQLGISGADEPLEWNVFQDAVEVAILEAIGYVYSGLSPENLSCDGEASQHHIINRRKVLNRQLKGLFMALGREVSETVQYDWWKARQEYLKEAKAIV